MTDESPSKSFEPVRAPPSCGGLMCLGCGVVLLLGLLGFGAASVVAGGSLDRRATRMRADLAAAQAAIVVDRPSIVRTTAATTIDLRNAVDDYRAIEWVLEPPLSMTTPPPGAGATGLGRAHPTTSRVSYLLVFPPGRSQDAMLDAGEPPTEAMRRVLDLYGPLARHVRDGVSRPRCDWGADLALGMRMEIPNLLVARCVSNYMAWQARDQTPLEAARTGIVVMAYGRDLARHPAFILCMMGCSIRTIGVRVLVRALARGLDRDGLREVEDALGRLEPFDLRAGLATERLGMQVELARMSGRLGEATGPLDMGHGGAGDVLHALGPVFFDREWTGLVEANDGVEAVLALPPAQREQAQAELGGRLSTYLYASMTIIDARDAQQTVDKANVELDLARLLVAAHEHRLETGAFPQDAKTLAARLGGRVPQDPFAPGKPLQLALKKDELRAWSVGPNLVDDRGVGPTSDTGDIVHVTRAPQ